MKLIFFSSSNILNRTITYLAIKKKKKKHTVFPNDRTSKQMHVKTTCRLSRQSNGVFPTSWKKPKCVTIGRDQACIKKFERLSPDKKLSSFPSQSVAAWNNDSLFLSFSIFFTIFFFLFSYFFFALQLSILFPTLT